MILKTLFHGLDFGKLQKYETGLYEFYRSLSKKAFTNALQKLIPSPGI